MAKMEAVLREEITRLSKREVKAVTEPLVKQIRALKKEVRQLKEALRESGTEVRTLEGPMMELTVDEEEAKAARVGPKWIKSLRKRLGLSQRDLAKLLGVSLSAVGTWEYGKAKPEGRNRRALITLRKMGKRQVKKLLESSH